VSEKNHLIRFRQVRFASNAGFPGHNQNQIYVPRAHKSGRPPDDSSMRLSERSSAVATEVVETRSDIEDSTIGADPISHLARFPL
jgi:hypothetical protein